MKHDNSKLIYSGNSLETFLKIKERLKTNGINYVDTQKCGDSWFRLLSQLILFNMASRGMNDERSMQYYIYVAAQDYDRAFPLLKN